MKKVAFYTLGCKLNYSETSTISRMFEEKGYRKVDFSDSPDIFIINTCSVTDNADKKMPQDRTRSQSNITRRVCGDHRLLRAAQAERDR